MYIHDANKAGIIQRNIYTAQTLKRQANTVYDLGATPYQRSLRCTAAVSDTHFAFNFNMSRRRQQMVSNRLRKPFAPHISKTYNQFLNHAERTLLSINGNLTNIGVNRKICNTCKNVIVQHNAAEHVCDPEGTYKVIHTPTAETQALNRKSPHRIDRGVGLLRVGN